MLAWLANSSSGNTPLLPFALLASHCDPVSSLRLAALFLFFLADLAAGQTARRGNDGWCETWGWHVVSKHTGWQPPGLVASLSCYHICSLTSSPGVCGLRSPSLFTAQTGEGQGDNRAGTCSALFRYSLNSKQPPPMSHCNPASSLHLTALFVLFLADLAAAQISQGRYD
jgi:hypothetical protein